MILPHRSLVWMNWGTNLHSPRQSETACGRLQGPMPQVLQAGTEIKLLGPESTEKLSTVNCCWHSSRKISCPARGIAEGTICEELRLHPQDCRLGTSEFLRRWEPLALTGIIMVLQSSPLQSLLLSSPKSGPFLACCFPQGAQRHESNKGTHGEVVIGALSM